MTTSASHLKCPICLQEYRTQKLLPCLHSICQNCLEKCIENSTVSEEKLYQFQCPLCRKIVIKPLSDMPVDQWAGHFPVNFALLPLLEKAKAKVDQHCDPCLYVGGSIAAKSYCATCKEALCELCDSVHHKSRATREHTFLTIDETADNPIALSLAVGITCTYHLNKDLEFYCASHDSMCCSDCVVDHHRGCNTILKLKQHADKLFNAEEPLTMTERIKQLESHLDKYTAVNNETLQKLKISTEDMMIEIDNLIATLNEAKSKISMEREALLEEESRKRRNESQQCQSLKAALRDSLIFLDAILKYGNRHQSLLILHKIKEQLAYCEKIIHEKHSEVRHVQAKLHLNDHFISLRKITGSQVAKIEMTENKLKLCLPFQQNYDVHSALKHVMLDEGLQSISTKTRDLGLNEKITEDCLINVLEARGVVSPTEILYAEDDEQKVLVSFESTSGDLCLPRTWTQMANDENLKCVILNSKEKEYIDVSQKFLASAGVAGQRAVKNAFAMNYGNTGLTVIAIERVQNKSLYLQYKARKRQLEKQNEGQANEKELWLGTAVRHIQNINHSGFYRSYGGNDSHGDGTFFAVNASYSVNFCCRVDSNGHRHIYLAHVMTGDSVVLGRKNTGSRTKDPYYPHITYDSTTDNWTNPQMFVIFHDTQAYPSYHITFC